MRIFKRMSLFIITAVFIVFLFNVPLPLFALAQDSELDDIQSTAERCELMHDWYYAGELTSRLHGDISEAVTCSKLDLKWWMTKNAGPFSPSTSASPVPTTTARIASPSDTTPEKGMPNDALQRCHLMKEWYSSGTLTPRLKGDITEAKQCASTYPAVWFEYNNSTSYPLCMELKEWKEEGKLSLLDSASQLMANQCASTFSDLWNDNYRLTFQECQRRRELSSNNPATAHSLSDIECKAKYSHMWTKNTSFISSPDFESPSITYKKSEERLVVSSCNMGIGFSLDYTTPISTTLKVFGQGVEKTVGQSSSGFYSRGYCMNSSFPLRELNITRSGSYTLIAETDSKHVVPGEESSNNVSQQQFNIEISSANGIVTGCVLDKATANGNSITVDVGGCKESILTDKGYQGGFMGIYIIFTQPGVWANSVGSEIRNAPITITDLKYNTLYEITYHMQYSGFQEFIDKPVFVVRTGKDPSLVSIGPQPISVPSLPQPATYPQAVQPEEPTLSRPPEQPQVNKDVFVPVEYEDEVRVNFLPVENPFPDTNVGSLEGKAASELYYRRVIGGFPDGDFKGDRPVNRAEAAKFLLQARGYKVSKTLTNSFKDVISTEWYGPYVLSAAEYKIISGHPDGTFRPAVGVNTVEFLKMLSLTFSIPEDLSYDYLDIPVDAWFRKYVGAAQKYNLFPNRNASELLPTLELTRNEVAVAIYQYLKNRNE